MSTTFGIKLENQGEPIEVAFRSNGIRFTNPLAELLPNNTPVFPIDNTAQGIYTIGDIKREIKKLTAKDICTDTQRTQGEWEISPIHKDGIRCGNEFMATTTGNNKFANAERIVRCVNNEWKIDMHNQLIDLVHNYLTRLSELQLVNPTQAKKEEIEIAENLLKQSKQK